MLLLILFLQFPNGVFVQYSLSNTRYPRVATSPHEMLITKVEIEDVVAGLGHLHGNEEGLERMRDEVGLEAISIVPSVGRRMRFGEASVKAEGKKTSLPVVKTNCPFTKRMSENGRTIRTSYYGNYGTFFFFISTRFISMLRLRLSIF